MGHAIGEVRNRSQFVDSPRAPRCPFPPVLRTILTDWGGLEVEVREDRERWDPTAGEWGYYT